jgi:hypothetical protein
MTVSLMEENTPPLKDTFISSAQVGWWVSYLGPSAWLLQAQSIHTVGHV